MISEELKVLTFIYFKKGNIYWVVDSGAGEEELRRTIEHTCSWCTLPHTLNLSEGWILKVLRFRILPAALLVERRESTH